MLYWWQTYSKQAGITGYYGFYYGKFLLKQSTLKPFENPLLRGGG
jgi:hypothetical protein